jgi:glycosyltransferase involved in cell wall biosynthesis
MAESVKTPLVSVVLCTYNPRADFVERVLEGLRRQTLPLERWEFIVVDNNSTKPLCSTMGPRDDGTTVIDLSWHPDARMVVEKQQGLSHARRRGFEEAKGELIVNLDDDAVIDPDYLEQVCEVARQHPFIGVFGGQRRAEFEVLPKWPREEYYGADRMVSEPIWSNDREHGPSLPTGAGSVVKKKVADAYVRKLANEPVWASLGRTAEKMLSCEDVEIAMIACDLGLGRGLFPQLKLTHLVEARKMTLDFLCRNAHGNGYSYTIHNYLRFGRLPSGRSVMGKINRLYQLARMPSRQRKQEMAKDHGIREAVDYIKRHLR